MKHYFILAMLLLAAIVFYIAGSATGAITLICMGALLELSFWYQLFRKRNQSNFI